MVKNQQYARVVYVDAVTHQWLDRYRQHSGVPTSAYLRRLIEADMRSRMNTPGRSA